MTARNPDGRPEDTIMSPRSDGSSAPAPESSAVRVALWRALHVLADPPPHVLRDETGLRLAAPEDGWRRRPDMDPDFTPVFRASIVARARFIEDMVAEHASRGVTQYVILGAGLDTFAQRRPPIASRLTVFEVDQPGPQAWKRQRLMELGFGIPDWLRLIPVDFETGGMWWQKLPEAGFNLGQPAVVASSGVSMYLTHDAIVAMLRQIATLARSSTLVMTFLMPLECADPEVRPGLGLAAKGAQASGTPFVSFFTPPEIQALAREAGLPKLATSPRPRSPSVTSPTGAMAFARPTTPRNCWSRRRRDDG